MESPPAPSATTVSVVLVAALFAGLVFFSHDGESSSTLARPHPSPPAPTTTTAATHVGFTPPLQASATSSAPANFTAIPSARVVDPSLGVLPGVLPPRPLVDDPDRDRLPEDFREPVRSFAPECWAEGMRGGLFGGIGDSLAREQSSQIHRLVFGRRWNWLVKCPGRTSPKVCQRRTVAMRYVGVPDVSSATPGGGTLVQWNARQADAAGVAQLLDAAPVTAAANVTLMVSRGLWDAMNLGAPPSQTFTDIKGIADVFAKRGGGDEGTVRRVVLYVPHCAHTHKEDHRATCGGTVHLGMYQRAVACAAAASLGSRAPAGGGDASASGGEVRLAVYDSCSVIAQDDPRGMHDSWHLSDRMRNRTLSLMLARFVCPRSAGAAGVDVRPSEDAGWYVDAPLVGGGEDGVRLREEAKRKIEARWHCRAFQQSAGADPGRHNASRPPSSSTNPLVPATTSAASPPPSKHAEADSSGWGWPQCPWARSSQGTELDAALGFEYRNECACSRGDFARVADGCWPSIMAAHRGPHKLRANYAHDQLCRLNNTPASAHRCVAAVPPSTLPERLAHTSNAAAVHEMGLVGCIAADAPQVLCMLNLGATVFPGVEREAVFRRFRDEAAMSDEDARAVCRCHDVEANPNVTRTAWCRSLRVVEARVQAIFNRSMKVMASETTRAHGKPLSGHALRWNAAINATLDSGSWFGCDAPSVMFLPMCPRLWELNDLRKPQPPDRAVFGWLRDGALNAHAVDLPLLSGKVPSYARW